MAGIGKTKLSVRLGLGGIGKTDLSLRLARGIQDQFEYVIWRSLLNAPKITEVLTDLIKSLSDQQEVKVPSTVDGQISRVLHYLRLHRCLLIFDNVEMILRSGEQAGHYDEGYEAYGQLFRQVAEVPHQSCLLLTSREKPSEIARLEGKTRPVRSLALGSLGYIDAQKIFAEIGSFSGSEEEWRDLNKFYNGNPLALELAARHISEVFFGNISEFLREGKPVFADLRELLDWHFDRLSNLQKEIMYWLAINREPMLLSELREDILSPVAKEQAPSMVQLLQRLLPLEKSFSHFTIQPVLIEYMTERLVEQVFEEIRNGKTELLSCYALIKALTKDYVRNSQICLILKPLMERLLSSLGKENIQKELKRMLSTLRETHPQKPSYIAGNVLNLLIQLQSDLRGYDFSHLIVWQAYLQGAALLDVNFAHSDLAKSVFTETFDNILSVAFSPKEDLLAGGTGNGDIWLWQTPGGTPLYACLGHSDWVRSIAFSPDGSIIVSGSEDQTVRLWDVSTGRCLKVLQGHSNLVRSVAFSPNGNIVASGSHDQSVRLWSVDTGECLKTLQEHTDIVCSVAFSPDGSTIVSVSRNQTVRFWSVDTGECLKTLQEQGSWIWSATFDRDVSILASGSHDGYVKLLDMQTGAFLKVLRSDRPYERMNITDVRGLTVAQKTTLRALGAIEDGESTLT